MESDFAVLLLGVIVRTVQYSVEGACDALRCAVVQETVAPKSGAQAPSMNVQMSIESDPEFVVDFVPLRNSFEPGPLEALESTYRTVSEASTHRRSRQTFSILKGLLQLPSASSCSARCTTVAEAMVSGNCKE